MHSIIMQDRAAPRLCPVSVSLMTVLASRGRKVRMTEAQMERGKVRWLWITLEILEELFDQWLFDRLPAGHHFGLRFEKRLGDKCTQGEISIVQEVRDLP